VIRGCPATRYGAPSPDMGMNEADPAAHPGPAETRMHGAVAAGSTRRARLRTRVRHLLEYALFRVLLFPLERLSWNAAGQVGRGLGAIAFSLLRIRRRVVLDNLAHAFPAWSPARRLAVARECYRQFGITFLELLLLPRTRPEDLVARATLGDSAQFDSALQGGHGAIIVTGHLGNWEALGASLAARGYPLFGLVARQRNLRVEAQVRRMRESAGIRLLYTDRGLMPVMRTLRGNGFIAFPIDQDAGRDGIFVEFLGRLASAPLGPVRFARRAGCPIIPGFCVRRPDGRYLLEMPGTVWVRADLPPDEAEREALTRLTALLEEVVHRYPEQWFWMHRRWKTRPPGETSKPGPR
jgi:Kdo2-lipid IVA lauroyltransferase/acyltransferase